jgi:hypothetical protein
MFSFMISMMCIGMLSIGIQSVHAASSFEWKEGDNLVHPLEDGDGVTRVFKFTSINIIKPDTKIRLFSNHIEIPSADFTIDYGKSTITIADTRKAPGSGSENHIEYPIRPTFEWSEGATIGNALSEGDGENRVFKITTASKIKPGAKVRLLINGVSTSASKFTVDYANHTVTIPNPPGMGAKIYFYYNKSDIIESTQPVDKPKENQPVAEPTANEFSIPSGESFPGTIKINSAETFTATITMKNIQPTYTSYLMIKNAEGKLMKRIQLNPAKPFANSLSSLNLAAGGYYFYLKSIDQWGHSAASVPQFIPIHNKNDHKIVVFINGKKQEYEQPAVSKNGRILVPLRSVFESLGATVKWNGSSQTVTAARGNTTVTLTIGSTRAYINGRLVTLTTPAQTINRKNNGSYSLCQ